MFLDSKDSVVYETAEQVEEYSELLEEYCIVCFDCLRCLVCSQSFRKKAFCKKVDVILRFLFYVGSVIYILYFGVSTFVEGIDEFYYEIPSVKQSVDRFSGNLPQIAVCGYAAYDDYKWNKTFLYDIRVQLRELVADYYFGKGFVPEKVISRECEGGGPICEIRECVIVNKNLEARKYDPHYPIDLVISKKYSAIKGKEEDDNSCEYSDTMPVFLRYSKINYSSIYDFLADNERELEDGGTYSRMPLIGIGNSVVELVATETKLKRISGKNIFSGEVSYSTSTSYDISSSIGSLSEYGNKGKVDSVLNGFGTKVYIDPRDGLTCCCADRLRISFSGFSNIFKEYYDFSFLVWLAKVGGSFAVLKLLFSLFMMCKVILDISFHNCVKVAAKCKKRSKIVTSDDEDSLSNASSGEKKLEVELSTVNESQKVLLLNEEDYNSL